MDRIQQIEHELRKLSSELRNAERWGQLSEVAAIEADIDTKLDELNAAKAGLR